MYQANFNINTPAGNPAKVHKFEPYFSGSPSSKFEFSYNSSTMFRAIDGIVTSINITVDQLSELNALHANEVIAAAYVFDETFNESE